MSANLHGSLHSNPIVLPGDDQAVAFQLELANSHFDFALGLNVARRGLHLEALAEHPELSRLASGNQVGHGLDDLYTHDPR